MTKFSFQIVYGRHNLLSISLKLDEQRVAIFMEDSAHSILLLLTYARGCPFNEGSVIESRKHEAPIAIVALFYYTRSPSWLHNW